MEILLQFIFKLADNALSTCKTICLSKDQNFRAALFAAVANYFYLTTIKAMSRSDSELLLYALCFAVFLGTYLPGTILKKAKRDTLYIFSITADNMENGKKFADIIRDNNIPIKTYKAYDSYMRKTLSCDVYCSTKVESSIVEQNIMPNFKYNVNIPDKF